MNDSAFKQRKFCSFRVAFLAFLWIASLIYGVYLGGRELSVVSLMRLSAYSQVSIVGLCYSLILPLFISIVAIYRLGTIAIYSISAISGLIAGITLGAASAAFTESAWLVYPILLFSESLSNIIMLWFLYRMVVLDLAFHKCEILITTALIILVGIADYIIVSPFWDALINRI